MLIASSHPSPCPASWRVSSYRLTYEPMIKPEKMPPPWTEKAIPGGFCFDDAEGKPLASVFGLDPRALPAAEHQRLTSDEDV